MEEFDTFRIELSGKETEEIIKNHMISLLKEKGYDFDYMKIEDERYYPDSIWRGLRPP